MTEQNRVRLTVWSDYVCPFCYLEEPVLERIRAEYGDQVETVWRAFELQSEPITASGSDERLRRVWSQSVAPLAQQRGLTLRIPSAPSQSRRALEAAKFARDRGRFEEIHRALFRAYFGEGRDLGDPDVLVDIGRSAGLDPEDLRQALEEGRYTQEVVEDERLADELGITTIPALRIGRADRPIQSAVTIDGALPYELVRAVIEQVIRAEAPTRHDPASSPAENT
jgi:predicted DsbA family dithiol-disulfide isomerase